MSPKRWFVLLIFPVLAMTLVEAWVMVRMDHWIDAPNVSLGSRFLLAASNFYIRYKFPCILVVTLASPLLAVPLASLVRTDGSASRELPLFLATIPVLLILSFGLVIVPRVITSSYPWFLFWWSALIANLLALALTYEGLREKHRVACTRWHPAWFVVAAVLATIAGELMLVYALILGVYLYWRLRKHREAPANAL